jgi:hypothetical protein
MKYLINYADSKYEPARKWNTWSARKIGKFDDVFEFHPEDVSKEFKQKYSDIFKEKRGNGLWLWKPYFVNKVLEASTDGDVIFYCDSGAFFIRNPQLVIDELSEENPLFVCDIPLIESCWTKPICFEKMECNNEWIKKSNQIIATYFVFRVNHFTRNFMKEWLDYCCDYDLLSSAGLKKYDKPTKYMGNAFVSHREDQSIFSLLCKKYNVTPHRDISQRGRDPESYKSKWYAYCEPNHAADKYGCILFLHKSPSLNILFWLRWLKNKLIQSFERKKSYKKRTSHNAIIK